MASLWSFQKTCRPCLEYFNFTKAPFETCTCEKWDLKSFKFYKKKLSKPRSSYCLDTLAKPENNISSSNFKNMTHEADKVCLPACSLSSYRWADNKDIFRRKSFFLDPSCVFCVSTWPRDHRGLVLLFDVFPMSKAGSLSGYGTPISLKTLERLIFSLRLMDITSRQSHTKLLFQSWKQSGQGRWHLF